LSEFFFDTKDEAIMVTVGETEMTLSERVYSLREDRGLSQEKAAQLCGLSVSSWAKIEQDAAGNVRLDTLKKLAKAFGLTLSQLLDGVD
jgi:transcriptional regulator with XRE-family HTH domain